MKMEPIVSSETSAIRTQTPGNYPKRNKLHLEHGESLKTRISLYVDTCIYQICLSSCHDTFDNCGRESEEVFPQLSRHEKNRIQDTATDVATLSVLTVILAFLGRFRSAGFLPHSMLEPVLKTDFCLTARDAPSTNPGKYISLSIQHVR